MLMKLITTLMLLLLTLTASSDGQKVIASGFEWAENLVFADNAMFVSDYNAGILYKLTRSSRNTTTTKTPWITNLTHPAGLATAPSAPNTVFLAANSAILSVSTLVPSSFSTLTNLTAEANGLTCADNTLYATLEANFVPLRGSIVAIPLSAPTQITAVSQLTSPDGAYASSALPSSPSPLIFFSEFLFHRILAYTPSSNTSLAHVASFEAPGVDSVDDLALFEFGMCVADFLKSRVVLFPLSPPPNLTPGKPITLLDNLRNPTSVRMGQGPSWEQSLYVTEGGPLLSVDHNRRVWEIPLPPSVVASVTADEA